MSDLQLPLRAYFRPYGESRTNILTIPGAWTENRQQQLDQIKSAEIEFTVEAFPTCMNICMDDGKFDYKYELVPTDAVYNTILRLIDEFDIEDYRRAAATHAEQEA